MADNLTPCFALPDHAVVTLEGPDAAVFAQAQFANDVLLLADGHWQWNTWLTPKGRVIAVFLLLRHRADKLQLILLDQSPDTFIEQLRRFVFRRKLVIGLDPASPASGSFTHPGSASGKRMGVAPAGIELDYGTSSQPRRLWIGAPAVTEPEAVEQWRRQDLQHGTPRLPEAQREQWTPQQLSLDRLQAYSVKKGCYPGQEIVARTHFLGKAKRALALFECPSPPSPGGKVGDGSRDLGEVICAQAGSPALALAVMPMDRESTGLSADGIPLREIPLLG